MTPDEAGRLREAWRARGNQPCSHSRVIDYLNSNNESEAGYLVCKECGEIFPDSLKPISGKHDAA